MALVLDRVTHRFGRQAALDAVTLHVERGDLYGFLGHNGAGKTTAMRIALGLMSPSAGRVLVDGFDASRYPREARARMGGLIETPGFYRGMDGRRNLLLLARLQGMTRREARVEADRLLDVVGLSYVGPKGVGSYSQGMRQRLGIAQAILGSPMLVLLDEPMNGLDPEGIGEMRALLRRLTRDEGMTVLLSSHQLREISDLCNRIAVIRQGRLLVEEETQLLLADARRRHRIRTSDDSGTDAILRDLGIEREPLQDGGFLASLNAVGPAELARCIVGRGIDLLELAPRTPSLEEVYLHYSRSAAAAAEAGGATDAAHDASNDATNDATNGDNRRRARSDGASRTKPSAAAGARTQGAPKAPPAGATKPAARAKTSAASAMTPAASAMTPAASATKPGKAARTPVAGVTKIDGSGSEPAIAVDPGARPERLAPPLPVLRVLRYELTRLTSYLSVALLALIPTMLAVMSVLRRKSQAMSQEAAVEGARLASTTSVTAFEAVAVGLEAGLPILLVILAGLASQSIAGGLQRGTLRNILLRPATRAETSLGKILSLLAVGFAAYALLAFTSVAAAAVLFDFTDVSEILPNGEPFLHVEAAKLWPQLRIVLIAPLLPLAAYTSIGLMAGGIARNGTSALGITLGAAVFLDLVRVFARELRVEGWLPSAHLPSVLGDVSFVRYYHESAQGVSNAAWSYADQAILSPLLWIVLPFLLTTWVLKRRSIP